MEGQIMLALGLALPVIFFPAAYIWYLTIGGIYAAIKETQKQRTARVGKGFAGTKR